MGDITQNFSRWEFKCKCGKCDENAVDKQLVEELEEARQDFVNEYGDSVYITITSGWRCKEYNDSPDVGGWPDSKHLDGLAADIVVNGVEPELVYNYFNAKYPDSHGLGNYNTFTHFDVRKEKARW